MSEEIIQEVIPAEGTSLAPQEPHIFKTALFGFNREEVLTYIDELTAKSVRADESARALQTSLTAEKDELEGKLNAALEELALAKQQLAELTARAQQTAEQLDEQSRKLQKANEQVESMKSRLYAKEQETIALKSSNDSLQGIVSQKEAELVSLRQQQLDDKAAMEAALQAEKESLRQEAAQQSAAAAALLEASRRQQQEELEAQQQLLAAGRTDLMRERQKAEEQFAAKQAEAKSRMQHSVGFIADANNSIEETLKQTEAAIEEATKSWQASAQKVESCLSVLAKEMGFMGSQLESFPNSKPAPWLAEESSDKVPCAQEGVGNTVPAKEAAPVPCETADADKKVVPEVQPVKTDKPAAKAMPKAAEPVRSAADTLLDKLSRFLGDL